MRFIKGFLAALVTVLLFFTIGIVALAPLVLIITFIPPGLFGASLMFGYIFFGFILALTPMFME